MSPIYRDFKPDTSECETTRANVHDSQVFDKLMDEKDEAVFGRQRVSIGRSERAFTRVYL